MGDISQMRLFVSIAFLMVLLSGCSRSHNRALARQGIINENAPVKAFVKITIDASVGRVWDCLTDIKDWPKWQLDIAKVSIRRKAGADVPFEWSTGAGSIHSRIALFKPPSRLAWTGRSFMFSAIHTWTLTPLPNGQTLVQVRESMGGWPIGFFYSSFDLLSADRQWLFDLKKRAES